MISYFLENCQLEFFKAWVESGLFQKILSLFLVGTWDTAYLELL